MILTKEFILKRIKEQQEYIRLKSIFTLHHKDPNYKRQEELINSAIA